MTAVRTLVRRKFTVLVGNPWPSPCCCKTIKVTSREEASSLLAHSDYIALRWCSYQQPQRPLPGWMKMENDISSAICKLHSVNSDFYETLHTARLWHKKLSVNRLILSNNIARSKPVHRICWEVPCGKRGCIWARLPSPSLHLQTPTHYTAIPCAQGTIWAHICKSHIWIITTV